MIKQFEQSKKMIKQMAGMQKNMGGMKGMGAMKNMGKGGKSKFPFF